MRVKTLLFNFVCEESVRGSADKLRGFFANKFGEYMLIHHHLDSNRFFYKSPLIQYKMLKGIPFVLGINEGADILQKIHIEIDYLKIGLVEYKIQEKNITLRTEDYEITSSHQSYNFRTPWLALNEKNYGQYRKLKTWPEKKGLLEKILIGNIISMSKSLGYTVPGPIKASIGKMKEVPTTLKGTPMLGFLGTFSVNFEIPDYWGVGKSVSRGFGTVKRQRTDDR